MPVEFVRETGCYDYHSYSLCDTTKLSLAYDGSGRRISKTRMKKTAFDGPWYATLVTHYTGIGTEVRENMPGGTLKDVRVVVNMPQGLGRYMPEDASAVDIGFGAGYIPSEKFEWYLKNHLGSTMLVYGTQGYSWTDVADVGVPVAAYDYRAFGEQVSLAEPAEKVTENFTGKELDDETELDYFGARYLDPMLGIWTSVDPKRQFASPYLYAGNGVNPLIGIDPDGNELDEVGQFLYDEFSEKDFMGSQILRDDWNEMKNSDIVYSFKFHKQDYSTNDKETNTIILPYSVRKNPMQIAIYGRHEYDHLKGIPKASWHDMPELFAPGGYWDLMEKNNSIQDNLKSGKKVQYEYDPIYGRDYKAWQEMFKNGKK